MSRFRALIIDDEEELAATLVERLAYRDIEAEYAVDGVMALEKISTRPYDVVVLDLKLPGISGREVLQRLKDHYPHLPVILITGHGTPNGSENEKPELAFDIIPKPIGLDALIEIMEAAIKIMNEQLTPQERERLEQSGRECFGSLTASMSHELNNVISIIDQNIGLLSDILLAGNDPVIIERSRFERVLTRLAAQAERGSTLIKLLNTFAHSVDVDERNVNLADVARLSQSLWKRIAEMHRVEIKNSSADGLVASPGLSYKAIWALFLAMRTAIEKCPPGRTIVVKTDKTAAGPAIIVEAPLEKDVDITASPELMNLMACIRGDLRVRHEAGCLIQELRFCRRE